MKTHNFYRILSMAIGLATATIAAAQVRSRVIEDGGTGPYKIVMTETKDLAGHTLFMPQDISAFDSDNPLPVLVWGNGACANSPWEHVNFLNEIASHGYLVLATGFIPMDNEPYKGPMSKTTQQIESIDWVIRHNADKNSGFYHKIDINAICLAGMSCGGLQSLFNCADPRISSLMICNSGLFKDENQAKAIPDMPMPSKNKLKEIHTPVIYILGDTADIAYENGMDDFHRIDNVPAYAANFPVGHGGTYRQPHGGEFSVVALAWLDWQLKKDPTAGTMFTGKKPTLKSRKGWTLERNHIAEADEVSATFVMQLRVNVSDAYSVGNVSQGKRTVIPITGGTFLGPDIRGTIIPGGADYQLQQDGRSTLEAIYSIKTDDGVNIHVRNRGIIATDKSGSFYFKTAPQFEAPVDSKYAWLNNAIFICAPGEPMKDGIVLNVWKVL